MGRTTRSSIGGRGRLPRPKTAGEDRFFTAPGAAITVVIVAALAAAGLALAVVSPLNSGGHLIGGLGCELAAGAVLIRLARVEYRRWSR
jgi:hypothetical protein